MPSGRSGGSYQKLERKVGDYATVGVAAHLEFATDGTIAKAGIALTSVNPVNTKVERCGADPRRAATERRALRRSGRSRGASSRSPHRRARLGRVETQRRGRIHPPGAGRRGCVLNEGERWRSRSPSTEPTHSHDVEPRTLLVDFVRTNAALTGTHIGCDTTSCGVCTVLARRHPGEVVHRARGAGRRPRR